MESPATIRRDPQDAPCLSREGQRNGPQRAEALGSRFQPQASPTAKNKQPHSAAVRQRIIYKSCLTPTWILSAYCGRCGLFEGSRKTYGSARIHPVLIRRCIACGLNRVARLMSRAGLRPIPKKRFRPQTTDSKHRQPGVSDERCKRCPARVSKLTS
ncbi:MAG: hypothetical protein CSA62_09615 [Planctomycetota bacterium]|nr:MAG: hypothetical protein CSA62_09615 [Planctomycetota bacterium]